MQTVDEQVIWAEINTDAIRHNFRQIKALFDEKVKLIGVIKANAYGHGAVKYGQILSQEGADGLAVARLDEALELRRNKIDLPILILGKVPEIQFTQAIKNRISITVFDLDYAKRLSELARRLGETANIHLKIDTGMGRLGFQVKKENVDQIPELLKLPNLHLQGIFTHFATADEKDKSFSHQQADRFEHFLQALAEKDIRADYVHCGNSAVIMDLPEYNHQEVRAGIILYGLYPSNQVNKARLPLRPVMTLKTRISSIKELPENSTISYGRTYITKRPSRIAALSVGYADGYDRSLSNQVDVLINRQRAPQVGRICMDQIMVDITDLTGDIRPGDEVILFGEHEITADELAEKLGTINYEVVCKVNRRVPRVYVNDQGEVEEVVNYLL